MYSPFNGKLAKDVSWTWLINCATGQTRFKELVAYGENFDVVDDISPTDTPWLTPSRDQELGAHLGVYCSDSPSADRQMRRIRASDWRSALSAAQSWIKR
jgi:hypothetical protein